MFKPDFLASIINAFFGKVTAGTASPAATLYATLLTTLPNSNGDGAGEVVIGVNAFARVAVPNNTGNFPTITAGGVKTTGAAITFPAPTGSWGDVVGIAFYDSSTAGNLLTWAQVATFTPATGSAPVIQPGAFQIQATNVL